MAPETITDVRLSHVLLPLSTAVSDAKVMTGRQRPMTEVSLLFVELETSEGHQGMGFAYVLREGGRAQYAHAEELAPLILGEDPSDISRIWDKLAWQGASIGRSGLSVQTIAAFDTALWDIKSRRADLPLSKLLGAHRNAVPCYNTSGGYFNTTIEEVIDNAHHSLAQGIRGIKMKVGQPDVRADIERVTALRKGIGDDVPIMIDANQQWDRGTALRFGRAVGDLGLTWIEEPLSAYDFDGHADLRSRLDTPIATGEMLSCVADHERLLTNRSVDIIQPDAPRIGGITPFLTVATLATRSHVKVTPHFVMELHLHLAAACPGETWVEHFEWLEPLFEERIVIENGCMVVPTRPGLGLTMSDQARFWTQASTRFN